MEGGRRVKRFSRLNRGRQSINGSQSLLPEVVSTSSSSSPEEALSNTISCCYCDLKTCALNEPIFRFGRNYAAYFRGWFAIGVGFGLAALFVVSFLLLLEFFTAFNSFIPNSHRLTDYFFGISPLSNISISSGVYVFIATLVSVSFHEFGHALAAASEGIHLEYIAIFIATLFPGALVAFNHDSLQALPSLSVLRVYCAGIWHNGVLSAVCGLGLMLLPVILFPCYPQGDGPTVLDVHSASPLFGYLSAGDMIMSLDGIRIHNRNEWMGMATLLDRQTLQSSKNSSYLESLRSHDGRKGYCVPYSMMEEGEEIQLSDNCPGDLTAFVTLEWLELNMSIDGNGKDGHQLTKIKAGLCLNAKEIVKLKKCGDGWVTALSNRSSCMCSQGESCLSPVQLPGLTWTEIMYSRPYAPECSEVGKSFAYSNTSMELQNNCFGTFVFVGNVIQMARSVHLTAYRPRWAFDFARGLPDVLERSLICTFHVSLTLALLNSLPVYFLDGESILEVTLCHFTSLSPRKRSKVLKVCLSGGTIIFILAFLRILIKHLL